MYLREEQSVAQTRNASQKARSKEVGKEGRAQDVKIDERTNRERTGRQTDSRQTQRSHHAADRQTATLVLLN